MRKRSEKSYRGENDLLGFGRPNDFGNYLLRAKLSKQYGLFGMIPMWGGIRLHEFYPPVSTVIVRYLGMKWAFIAYVAAVAATWSIGRDTLTCLLFMISYHHFRPLIEAGRFSEFLGYLFVAGALFTQHSITAGVLLGLAGLCYPSPLFFGVVAVSYRFDWTLYVIALIVCGPWYAQFLWKSRRLSWLKEARRDKVFGLYVTQWAMMANVAVFAFGPMWAKILITVSLWFAPVSVQLQRGKNRVSLSLSSLERRLKVFVAVKPFYSRDLLQRIPGLQGIDEPLILLSQGGGFEELWLSENVKARGQAGEKVHHDGWDPLRGSLVMLIWPCACWLINRGTVVFNGLPSTEVPESHVSHIPDLPVYSIEEMMAEKPGLNSAEELSL